MKKFPDGFLWGAATAAHQVEGHNNNDWTEWEKANAERLAKEAQNYWQPWQQEKFPEMFNPANYISGRACDHYNRYEEDFDLAKEMGHNAHRFSIEWSRIEPEEGKFNQDEIKHYQKVILALRERGMEPFVTLWHWTNPIWIQNIGGWQNKKTIDYFLRYVEKIANEYKYLVNFWMPLNEPGSFVGMAFIQGSFPPQKRNIFTANLVFKNLMNAYRKSYAVIKKITPRSEIGLSHYATYMEPYKNRIRNRIIVPVLDYIRNWRFLDTVNDYNDFIGIQYYHHDLVNLKFGKGRWGPIEVKSENLWTNDMGWEIYPEGIYHILKKAAVYKKPIYITENGTADANDEHRARFIREHLKYVAQAIEEGVDVHGYFHWSLLDNFEWDKGFWPRFGLVEIDYETLERKRRPSSYTYEKIIKSNAIEVND